MTTTSVGAPSDAERLHALDAVRAGALLLGVAFHAAAAYVPGPPIWVVRDAQSVELGVFFFVTHIFRMSLFFFIAGFFARMMLQRRGVGGFIKNRAVRIAAPFAIFWLPVLAGIIACFIFGYLAQHPEAAQPGAQPPPSPPLTADTVPLTHLWFLYVLVILYAGALLLRGLVVAIDRQGKLRAGVLDPIVRFVVKARLTELVLALPIAFALYMSKDWYAWFGVPTPDKGLIPNTPALVAFSLAFGFGWVMNRQIDLLNVWRRNWPLNIGAAIILTIVSLSFQGTTPVFTPAAHDWKTLLYAGCYALAMWTWVTGVIGAALRFLSKRNPVIRYVADASYWIYIAHLPLVMALQVWVYRFDWPWQAKFALVLWIAYTTLFASYHVLVRYSVVGAMLNGRKHEPCKKPAATALAAAE